MHVGQLLSSPNASILALHKHGFEIAKPDLDSVIELLSGRLGSSNSTS